MSRATRESRPVWFRWHLRQASTGAERLDVAWSWARAELAATAKTDPGLADRRRGELAEIIAGFASGEATAHAPAAKSGGLRGLLRRV